MLKQINVIWSQDCSERWKNCISTWQGSYHRSQTGTGFFDFCSRQCGSHSSQPRESYTCVNWVFPFWQVVKERFHSQDGDRTGALPFPNRELNRRAREIWIIVIVGAPFVLSVKLLARYLPSWFLHPFNAIKRTFTKLMITFVVKSFLPQGPAN